MKIAAGTLALVPFGRRPASGAQFEYKYHHDLPVDSPMHVRLVQLWSEVAQATSGRLIVRIFPNSSLGSDASMVTQVRDGAVQLASMTAAAGVITATNVPFIGFAFKSEAAALAAMDGKLGDAVCREIEAKGFRVVAKPMFEAGLQQVTTSAHPIVTPADLAGLKIRVPNSRYTVDLFRTLGANPTPVDFAQTYVSLQTHLVDGAESSLSSIEFMRLFEVQRYLSLSNHRWGGYWMVANPDAWKALPAGDQRTVERLVPKYVALQRRDIALLGRTLLDKVTRQGMQVNPIDADAFRARLGPYYARCKADFGSSLWTLLEEYGGGKLG